MAEAIRFYMDQHFPGPGEQRGNAATFARHLPAAGELDIGRTMEASDGHGSR